MWEETYRASAAHKKLTGVMYDVFAPTSNPKSKTFLTDGLNRVIVKAAGIVRFGEKGVLESLKNENIKFSKRGKERIVDFLQFVIICIDESIANNSDIKVEEFHDEIRKVFDVSLRLIYHVQMSGTNPRSSLFSYKYFVENMKLNNNFI